jgi:hypothetical protein
MATNPNPTTMKIEDQQTAIAKVCNNLFFKNAENVWCFMSPDLGLIEWSINDHNACYKMENVLTNKQFDEYCCRLDAVGGMRHCDHATAAEKAEAFLRTLNLWTSTPTQPQ